MNYPIFRYLVRDDPATPPKLAYSPDDDAALREAGYVSWDEAPLFGELSESPINVSQSPITEPPEPVVDPRDALRAEYEALTGKAPDGRWSEQRLRDEVAALSGGIHG